MTSILDQAVRNNAVWCDAVCRAHGLDTMFLPEAWVCNGPPPRFYPNLITLDRVEGQNAQLFLINSRRQPAANWAVKDSYAALDLVPFGFQPLFEAQWVARAPNLPLTCQPLDGVTWARVQTEPDLERWETAWGRLPGEARVFLPALLADPNIVFLAGWREGEIQAGLAACCSGEVVGISNVFAPAANEIDWWAGGLSHVMGSFPGLPVVDYEHGPSLELVRTLGFDEIGPLVVWVH